MVISVGLNSVGPKFLGDTLPRKKVLAQKYLLFVFCVGCGSAAAEAGQSVPPLPRDFSDVLMVWYDESGAHTAESIDQVPPAARQLVRVNSANYPADSDHIFVADLRELSNGSYRVTRMPRATFEAQVLALRTPDEAESATGNASEAPNGDGTPEPLAGGNGQVVIYGASWCGACHQAADYLRQRGIAFVERDIEREPQARAEMNARARAQGLSPRGIPVIIVNGQVILGFDAQAIEQALRRSPSNNGAQNSGSNEPRVRT